MNPNTEAAAWLHAHGVDLGLRELEDALRSVLAADGSAGPYSAPAGQEGLTENEIELLRAAGGSVDAPAQGASDPLAESVVAHTRLLRTGLTTREAADRLGVTDARIRQRIDDRSLLALRFGRSWRLPAFQFTPDGEVPGWGEVCRALPPDDAPVAIERWFHLPQDDLTVGADEHPVSPRDWLLAGRPAAPVAALAAGLG